MKLPLHLSVFTIGLAWGISSLVPPSADAAATTDEVRMLARDVYVYGFPIVLMELTMYDNEGFQVPNPINRFAIGDRDKLTINEDGSLDIYIQHESPGPDKEFNWLPAPPSGLMGPTLRIYAPKPEALNGTWTPPPMRRVP